MEKSNSAANCKQYPVYRPPKFAPVLMKEDKISKKDKNVVRKDQEMLRRAKENDYITSLVNEALGRPEEVRETMGVESREHKRYIEKLQQRAEKEEDLFQRAPVTKSEKQKIKHLMKSVNGLSGLTDGLFDDIGSIQFDFDAPEQSGGFNNAGSLDIAPKRRKKRRH